MKNLVILLPFLLLLAACTSKEEKQLQEAKALYKSSMDIHDSIMPQMDKLYTLETDLRRQYDSLKGDSVAHAARLETLRRHISSLETAAADMMDWMHHIVDVPGEQGHHHTAADSTTPASAEEILAAQQEQKARIEKVKEEMQSAIEAAEAITAKQK